MDPARVDTIVTISTTPDLMIPPLDYVISSKLELRGRATFDLRAPCAGLFRAIMLVDALIASGRSECALIIGAETFSPFFRFGPGVPIDHRLSCVLYADGAGAIVVEPGDARGLGLQSLVLHCATDGSPPGLTFPGHMSAMPPGGADTMAYLGYQDFRAVLDRGSDLFGRAGDEVLRATKTELADYKFVLTHQATGNMRAIAERHGVPASKLPINIDHVGNTVAASILIVLDELDTAGRLDRGDRLMFLAAESSTWSYAGLSLLWG